MIRREYTGNARRARNYIWNAAGRYDFEPPYIAFYPTGEVDMYFNMVIGLAVKWFDMDCLTAFFDSYKNSRSADEYDEFLWLGIENCVFAKELSERPILAQLRIDRANDFFRIQNSLSRQQVEMQSMAVYDQQAARWSEVLGRHVLLAGKKRKMYEFLKFEGKLDTEGLVARMNEFFEEFFHFTPGISEEKRSFRLADSLRRGFGKRRGSSEKLMVRTADGGGITDKDVQLTHTAGMRYGFAPDEKDEDYIRACFGDCAYSDEEMRILEEALCTDGDAACRLWVVKPPRNGAEAGTSMNGRSSSAEGNTPISKDARDFLTKAAEQRRRNEKYRNENALMINESIKRLSAALGALFESYSRHLPEKARAGRLVARNAYRLSVVHDPYVFLRDGDETENNLRVTLLLDASMSRLYSQEKIAAEAYVIASSLERIHIPFEILSYRTIRGFTVIEKLKESAEKRADSVLRYTAGGWNRDSLAFRTVGRMIREEDPNRKQSHILLILTDASPNDSMPIASGGLLGGKEYEGELSVREARKAVSALREDGIRTSAIFLGSSAHLDNVHQIFGKEYVRIQTIAQLADGVSELIAMMLRESPPD
ncbi:MAG: hypothetical protein IKD59_07435, partial [Lachnospiraceae bacterium]|nr:hypothetical protein [Lachnospiraceae bacterium]